MKHFLLLGLTAALLAFSAHAQFIDIRVSYKAVLNPATGQRAQNFTDAQIDQAIAQMNQLQAGYRRGFRFVRVDPIWNVGSLGDTTGPSRWFNSNFADQNNGLIWRDQMETAARNDARYVWNNGAINIYLTDGISGGLGSRPGHDIIILGGAIAADGARHMREIGRYFDLCSTHGCACGDCGPNPGQCNTPGDDGFLDTLADLPCWDQDAIALYNYGNTYANIQPWLQPQVDNTFYNIMSGRNNTSRLTSEQLNRWTDTAISTRRSVTTGRTWSVWDASTCAFQTGYSECNLGFGGPLGSLDAAIDLANPAGGDILRIWSGSFNGARTITKPLTLRTRINGDGDVTLGR